MKEYKITIKELTKVEGEKYPQEKDIYEQTVSELPLNKIILVINSLEDIK